MMWTPEVGADGLKHLQDALLAIPPRPAMRQTPPSFAKTERVLSIREAMLSRSERVSVRESLGRVLAAPSVGCPPAVPIVVCGERIDTQAVERFAYYGIEQCSVVAEKTGFA